MQLAQQHGLPVVPGVRPHAANIADRQHRQQVQPFAGGDGAGKIAGGARIPDIAFLRHVGHQKVIAHQPFDGFAFLGIQTQTRGDLAGDLGAQNRMILGAAFADVVQQKRHIHHAAVYPLTKNGRGQRQVFDQLPPFDLRKDRDGLNDMFVHRIGMIDVELHHRDDGFKLRDEGGQNAQFVHPAQGAFGISVADHQIQKDSLGFGVVAHVVVDQRQVGGDQTHDIGVQQIA